jgi:ATP-binding cassette subfamily F protein 3
LQDLEKNAPSLHKEKEDANMHKNRNIPLSLPAGEEQGEKWKTRKEQQRALKRLEKNVAECETKIEKLEAGLKEMEQILNTPEGASNMDLLWKHAEWQKKIEDTMNEWTKATIALDDYKK